MMTTGEIHVAEVVIVFIHLAINPFSAVQFSPNWYLHAPVRPVCAPFRLSELSPELPLKRFQCWSD